MGYRKRRPASLIFFFLAFMLLFFTYAWLILPEQESLQVGDRLDLRWRFPASLLAGLSRIEVQEGATVLTDAPGQWHLTLRFFGLIPIKNVVVEVVPPLRVVPGGHAIGVLLQSPGVAVVGFAPVLGPQGSRHYPAREAGLLLGDTILRLNGQPVDTDARAAELIDQGGRTGRPLAVEVQRGGRRLTLSVQPLYCQETGRYRIGLYIRDGAAGVGTLTFYLPDAGVYGALGHQVVDDTGGKVSGQVVEASIQGIQQGYRGQPGEKIGLFVEGGDLEGSIECNTRHGIFGRLRRPLTNDLYREPIPVALENQVYPGAAEILTVINGEEIERFQVEIERVMPHQRHDGKGLVVHITDPRLLRLTGGIIQGMSGSPLIQGGRLVGAVTHVFVNDPTRGYGVLAEWMLEEAGSLRVAAPAA